MYSDFICNFISIRNLIPWRRTIMCIDTKENHLDRLLSVSNIPVHYRLDGVKEGSPFVFRIFSYWKKYDTAVRDCLLRLDKTLTFARSGEYLTFKKEANEILEGALKIKP